MERAIVELHLKGHSHAFIADTLHTGLHKIGRVIKEYNATNKIPESVKRGRPPKVSNNMRDFIEIRTL